MPRSTPMPWVVEQMNLFTLSVGGVILGVLLFFCCRGFGWVGAMIGLALAFIPMLVGLAFYPYNPFRGMGGHIVSSADGDQTKSDQ